MHRRATRPRRGRADDAEQAGRICFEAFRAVATAPASSRLPLGETAAGLLSDLLTHHGFYLVAAEQHGRIVGTNFLDGGSTIAGVGPITIDPLAQDSGVGTVLMTDVIERARCTGVAAAIAMTTNEPLGTAPGRIPVSTQ
jgi:GNAT superfamily N-acetyltransferase